MVNFRIRAERDKYAEKIASFEREIHALEGEYRTVLSQVAIQAPRLQELLASKAASLQQFQESMRQDSYEVLSYLVLDDTVVLLAY